MTNRGIDSKWYLRFLNLSESVSQWSKDPQIKVGCVLVHSLDRSQIVFGYNGFPKGVTDDIRYQDKKQKHRLILHAEVNAILNSRRNLTDYHLYSSRFPCKACTLIIIQSGIKRIFTRMPSDIDIWKHKSEYLEVLSVLEETDTIINILYNDTSVSIDTVRRTFMESDERAND